MLKKILFISILLSVYLNANTITKSDEKYQQCEKNYIECSAKCDFEKSDEEYVKCMAKCENSYEDCLFPEEENIEKNQN